MSKNFDIFLNLDAKKYANQYVVIIDKKVVANGKDIVSMMKNVRKKYPKKPRSLLRFLKNQCLFYDYIPLS